MLANASISYMALFKPSDFLPATSGRFQSFYSYPDAPLTVINAKYKPKEATFDILKVKRFISTCAGRFVEWNLNSIELLLSVGNCQRKSKNCISFVTIATSECFYKIHGLLVDIF